MKLQGRNLSIEKEDIKLHHSEPKLFNSFISDIELNERLFGENTREPFIKFRKANKNLVETFEDRESSTIPIRIQEKLIITCCQNESFAMNSSSTGRRVGKNRKWISLFIENQREIKKW
jgi:hypothetical protein